MPLPAGRRQELAGLLLARAGARDQGGVAPGLQDGFGVENLAHRDLISSRSHNDRPSPGGGGPPPSSRTGTPSLTDVGEDHPGAARI